MVFETTNFLHINISIVKDTCCELRLLHDACIILKDHLEDDSE